MATKKKTYSRFLGSESIWFWFLITAIFGVGTLQGYQLGFPDFKVFYVAGNHVWNGQAGLMYSVSPDRYLYAPGFAWFLSLLSLVGPASAFFFWTLLKIIFTPFVLLQMMKKLNLKLGIATLAVLTVARPILIDLRYGQINLLVLLSLLVSAIGFSSWVKGKRQFWVPVAWCVAAVLAVAKLYALPFLLVPFLWLIFSWNKKNIKLILPVLLAIAVGTLAVICIPFVTLGFEKGWELSLQWVQALGQKGFPLETHNQSFLAFLARQFTGKSAHVMGLYREINTTWFAVLSDSALKQVGIAWVLFGIGWILGHLISYARDPSLLPVAFLAIGILILPSHLVWKPYFVFALPLAVLAWQRAPVLAALGAFLMNFTSFSVLGLWLGPRAESASMLFFVMVLLYVAAIQTKTKSRKPF